MPYDIAVVYACDIAPKKGRFLMEVLREMAPFAVGLVLPPVLYLIIPRNWQGALRFWAVYGSALLLGVLVSLVMGELLVDLPEAIVAIVIDSSLVFAASQVAYRLVWKSIIESRLARTTVAATKQ
jgi:hypothetical protein